MQRTARRKGKLSSEQQRLLELLPRWEWDQRDALWEVGYSYLQGYVMLQGDAKVPQSYVTQTGYKLGLWALTQRVAYRKGKLPSNRQQRLEQLPGWTWNQSYPPRSDGYESQKRHRSDMSWECGIELLRKYAANNGHTRVPENSQFGKWVSIQRRIRRGRMPVEQKEELEKVPYWAWDPDWDKGIQALRVYTIATGHTNVSTRYFAGDGFMLGKWVHMKQESWIMGTLPTSERMQLERFPGWIETCLELAKEPPVWLKDHPDSWINGFRQLRSYADREGHTLIPKDHISEDGLFLGRWVREQRAAHTESRLSPKQQRLLEKLPGWVWDISQVDWTTDDPPIIQEGFGLLREFTKLDNTTGSTLVAKAFAAKDDIWRDWARRCRLKYRGCRLSTKAIWLLENIQGWTWELQETSWNRRKSREVLKNKALDEQWWKQGYRHICQYVNQNGHMYVSQEYVTEDDFPLGKWFAEQLIAYSTGRLSKSQREALERLEKKKWRPRKS